MTIKFVGKHYRRMVELDVITYEAAALLDRQYARRVRRRPEEAAVVKAERLLLRESRRKRGI